MNKIMKLAALLICAALTLALIPGLTVYGASTISSGRFGDGNNLMWQLDTSGTLTISGQGEMPTLGTGSYPWNKAFSVRIRSVIIEDGITTIGGDAFAYQENLLSATIPDSVTTIRYGVFLSCTNLTEVNIGSGIETIEAWTFLDCKNLKDVYYSGSRGDWAKINIASNNNSLNNAEIHFAKTSPWTVASGSCGPGLYWKLDGDCNLTISGTGYMYDMSDGSPWADESNAIFSIIVEDGVETIGENAFSNLRRVADVSLSDSVTAIGDNAFRGCYNLTSIDIPDSVTELGDGVLYSCSHLTDAKIGSGITSIGSEAFSGCNALVNLELTKGLRTIESRAFYSCQKLETLILPDSVTSIGYMSFSDCSDLKQLHLSSNLTTIGDAAFSGCKSIVSIDIPDSVTHVGESAFKYCTGLTDATIGSGLKNAAYEMFKGCSSLTGVTFGNNTESIEGLIFDGCTSLKSITVPAGLKTVYQGAFRECYSLTDVYYGGSQEDWNAIDIYPSNPCLTNANIHYNSFIPVPPAAEIKNVSVKNDGDRFNVTVTSENVPAYAVMIAAGYSRDGALLETAPVIDSSAVLTDDGIVTVKVFCWDGLKSLHPLCGAVSTEL